MSIAEKILQSITGGGYQRALANPMPQASDEDILRLYAGRYNQYATPEALRDVELGLQQYLDMPARDPLFFDNLRDKGLRMRGLRYDQSFDEIPELSPTKRILRDMINLPNTGEYTGA